MFMFIFTLSKTASSFVNIHISDPKLFVGLLASIFILSTAPASPEQYNFLTSIPDIAIISEERYPSNGSKFITLLPFKTKSISSSALMKLVFTLSPV